MDTHGQGGMPRGKSNTHNMFKKTTKIIFTTQQKYVMSKQCIVELNGQNKQSKKQKKSG